MYQLGLSGIDDGLGRLSAASGSYNRTYRYGGANWLTAFNGQSYGYGDGGPYHAVDRIGGTGRGGVLKGAETALRRGLVDIALCWVMSDAGLRRSEADATPRTARNLRNN